HVSKTLGGARVLADVSLAVPRGAGLGIVGANGSGKSTLLRILRGELWPDPDDRGRRLFALDGDAPDPSPIGARARFALVSPEAQDAYARRGWDLPVEAAIRAGFFDALWPEAPATPEQAARIRDVAALLGIAPLLGRSMLALSRGEGRRVLLARALAPEPALLLLDEVCDGLDRHAREVVLGDVARVLRAGTAVVMATHRQEELVEGIETVVRLEGGRIVGRGAMGDSRREPALDRPRRRALRAPARLRRAAAGSAVVERQGLRPRHPRTQLAFEIEEVTVELAGRPVLRDVTWSLARGESCAIVGPNGAGKSTLLRLLAGDEHPRHGRVRRLDLPEDASLWDVRRRIALVSPELQARHAIPATAEEIVLSGFEGTVGLAATPTGAERAAAAAALARVGLSGLAGRRADTLSYGELRRVLLARAAAPGPEVLLLDEPASGLDHAARAAMRAALDALAREGRSIVLVTHRDDEIPPAIRRRDRLEAGRLAPEPGLRR
ncbi:MAG TPA: ATP-binding cassette domain-containing protein, partial [Anaeromyxobacteraceae bacterium]|nr:ATP-binding cassette domain-containing protein [Anaeromyxobacteraceae bacterium]